MTHPYTVGDEAAPEVLYDTANPTSLKELDHVSEDYAKFIAASPFVIMSSIGPEGVDCSPAPSPHART